MAAKSGNTNFIDTDVNNQRGVVRSVHGKNAVVGFARAQACDKCGACFGKAGEGMFVEIANTLGAKPGQQVELAFGKNSVILAALTAYGFPLLVLILGISAGMIFLPDSGVRELLAAGMGLGLCAIVFIVLRLREPKRKKLPRYKLQMVRILD